MNSLFAFIKRLIDKKFYGKLQIHFQNGKIVKFEYSTSVDPKEFAD